MNIRHGESRYGTSVYYVRERPEYNEYRVTATLTHDKSRWIVLCHGCPSSVNQVCVHAEAVRAPLEARA